MEKDSHSTADDTFKMLRRISVMEMHTVLRKHFDSRSFTFAEFRQLLKEHHWTQAEYDNEYKELAAKLVEKVYGNNN
jgi:replication initiation and membrane attachment protein DnaB